MHGAAAPLIFGPWSPALSNVAERNAQLRSMATNAFMQAQDLVERLPPIWRPKLLSVFMHVTWPRAPP